MTTVGRLRRARPGVTYIEVLVVIVIIGLLAAIALPAFTGQEERAEDSAAQQNLHVALRAAQASTENETNLFPEFDVLVQRMRAAEPSLEIAGLPSLLAPATTENEVYVIRSGTDETAVLLAAKSKSGVLHTLRWERGMLESGELVQPTYEQLVKALGPSAYWPLAGDRNDRSPNGYTLTGAPQPGSGQGLLFEDPSLSTFFPGNQQLDSNYETRRNLIHSPDGETTATWSYQAGSEVSPVVDTNHARFGSSSLRITTTGTKTFQEGFQSHPTPLLGEIEPGKPYTLSGYMRNEDGVPMQAAIEWRREDLSQITGATARGASLVSNGEWVRVSVTGIAPPEAAAASPKFIFNGPGQSVGPHTVWLDGVLLEQTDQLRPYFSGAGYVDATGQWVDNTAKTDKRTGWSGTPHNSPSASGVFADGTQRTFVVWARGVDGDAFYSMLGNNAGTWDEGSLHIRHTPAQTQSPSTADALELNLGGQRYRYQAGSWPGPGKPVMVVVIVDETTDQVEAYVNGRPAGAPTSSPGAWSWDNAAGRALRIGQASGSPRWKGDLGQVAVFERALSPTEVCSLWHAGAGEQCFAD